MSPLGIKRTVAVLLILSPWIFIPSPIKDVIFIIAGIFLFISTLDLRKRSFSISETPNPQQEETESKPVAKHIVNA